MAGETPITVVGNLTADPELRFTPSGAAVANFTVASTPRTFDRQTNDWKDGEALFLNCSVWRQAAENAAESLTRGMRVIVSGRLKARSYETREGEKRTVFEIDVDEVGPSMKYATAKVTKTSRSGGGQGFGGGGSSDDPWASNQGGGSQTSQSGQGGGSWGGNQGGQGGGSQGGQSGGQSDPWATSGAGGHSEEPPF
jgi:single-strand DNA-binding protein